ncbi:MAG TPA: DUF5916 domain-containing protein [Candidatus Dormibacteraeota bacterium]|nr:DUF5916 domain-containing protein [Candidatus Dormibacteraeota bacterium]
MGPFIRNFLVGFYCFCALGGYLGAKNPSPQTMGASIPLAAIPRVQRAPKLADFLENRPREAELVVTDFRQNLPGDGNSATESTAAYLSYDDKNLYVAFLCLDDPRQVRAHLSKREDSDQDDSVGVLLDTFRDFHRSYLFSSNPLGVQTDAIFTEGQGYDYSFDTLWDNAGRITKDGYIVFFSIPFKSLRFSHAEKHTWGIALSRIILRKSEYDYWPYITQRVEGKTQQFAALSGLENVSPGRNIQFIPYGLLATNNYLYQPHPPNPATPPEFRDKFEHRAGLDAKFVAKDALTFDITLNPDFSQVESDDPQVTVNQRFAVFFPEKRPFFIENAGFFTTPINLFFSRQIADPQFGGRMTGKLGQWTLGALVIDDRQPGRRYPSGPYETRAVNGVVRVTREFGKQSYIGGFLSTRDFSDTNNRVASLDARLKLSKNWVVDLQSAHSWTRQDTLAGQDCLTFHPNPQGIRSQQGSTLWADTSYSGRHFYFSTLYDDYSPGFCSELGFITRVDIRRNNTTAGYVWRPKNRKIIDYGPVVSEFLDWNHNGVLQDWGAAVGFQVDFTKQTTLLISRGEAFELFRGIGFRKHSTSFSVTSQPYKWASFTARYTQGIGVNYYPAPTLMPALPYLGNTNRINFGFTFRPSARFRFDEMFIYSRLGTRDRWTTPPFSPGQNVFNNYLMRAKLNYQFTREFSLRLILDYNATLANPSLVDLQTNLGSYDGGPIAPRKKFATDVLFTYLLHPGTAVYIGYNHGYSDLQLRQFTPFVMAQGPPNNSSSRLFFIKVSYLLRY